jgi:7-carboxy-7-deazaguanine synthase
MECLMIKISVSEIFTSMSGEVGGAFPQGSIATFIRLQGCNLNCPWCDSKYTVDTHNQYELIVEEILKLILVDNVLITGGEPLLQRAGVNKLLTVLLPLNKKVSIETNGTQRIPKTVEADIAHWIIDRKMYLNVDLVDYVELHSFALSKPNTTIKYVVENLDHLSQAMEEIEWLVNNQELGVRCRFAISPININNKNMVSYQTILNQIIIHNLGNYVTINAQLHKFLNLP